MKISIITICFNNENEISKTIKSVVDQSYSIIEYIIVDGASTDKTIDIVRSYGKHISKIISEPDNGIYDAINKGIRAATGDIIGLIHAGDELFDKKIIEKISVHFNTHEIDALYGHSKIFSQDGKNIVRINKSPEYKENLFNLGWFPSHQSFYAKRELFEKYGYYNTKYRIAADYELLLRFTNVHKIKIILLDEYIVKFMLGGTSTKSIKNILRLNKECLDAWKDNGLSIPFYTIPFKLINRVIQIIKANVSQI